jgi:hypothetical protein
MIVMAEKYICNPCLNRRKDQDRSLEILKESIDRSTMCEEPAVWAGSPCTNDAANKIKTDHPDEHPDNKL